MSLSPDGRRMLVVSSSNGLAFRPTPTDPLSYGFDGAVKARGVAVWDMETGQRVFTLLKDPGFVTIAPPQFSPDGRTILFPDPMSEDLQIVDAGTGAAVRTLSEPKSDRNNRWAVAEFSPDGRTVAARKSGGRFVWFWSTGTGELLGSFEIPDGYAGWEAIGGFSPDSTRFATVADRLVHIIDVATRTGTQVLRGHEAKVNSMEFSPDGSRLLTGSDDQSAAVWEVSTGRILAVYKGHPGPVRLVAYSPDGKRVATASTDPLVRVWPIDLIPVFERRSPRALTLQERERYELPRK
jgi:WD40 repeat protein